VSFSASPRIGLGTSRLGAAGSREDAYALCSVAVDFNITQAVDGTKGVHAMIPKSIFK